MHRTLRAVVAAAALTLFPAADAVAAPYASRTLQQGHQRQRRRGAPALPRRGRLRHDRRRRVRPRDGAQRARLRDRRAAHASDGKATRSDQRLVQSRAESAEARARRRGRRAGLRRRHGLAVAPASAPAEVKAIIAAGNKIASKPYRYGGGHGRWRDSGYDCSGSVSYALHGAGLLDTPLDSTGFMRWGEPRPAASG